MTGKSTRARPAHVALVGNTEIEARLRSGEDDAELREYFGDERFQELQSLAQQAARTRRRADRGPRVYVVPGIMGSTLGRKRRLLNDTLWVDPFKIALGWLTRLALPDGGRSVPLGVLLITYLKLKLTLEAAGFDVDFHPFDWRQSVDTLGAELMRRVEADGAGSVALVAHSMGGLVARAALALDTHHKIGRLVMLGTPNFGSFAPVQAMRGTYSSVRAIAALDLKHRPEILSRRVFSTFPGLTQMFPAPEKFAGIDLYSARTWPDDGPKPAAGLLAAVAGVRAGLALPDDRFYLIAGVEQETTVSMSVVAGKFQYEVSKAGDGTVPRAFCELPPTRTYYVVESHGSLPNNGLVGRAVVDILRNGATPLLPVQWPATRSSRRVTEKEMRTAVQRKAWNRMTAAERRAFWEGMLQIQPRAKGGQTPPPAPPAPVGGKHIIMGRSARRPIEIRLAKGSITEANARALVLGIFKNVEPAGAATAIDARLGGAVREFTRRRMFTGDVGEVFVMPTARSLLRAESVLFVGLGNFDAFSKSSSVHEFVAENVVRTFVRTQVEDFATVLWGTSSGSFIRNALEHQLRGYFKGMADADPDRLLRRITFCMLDDDKYGQMRSALLSLAGTDLFDDVEATISEIELAGVKITEPESRAQRISGPSPAYLLVNQRVDEGGRVELEASLLTAGGKATTIRSQKRLVPKAIDKHLDGLQYSSFNFRCMRRFGESLADLLFDETLKAALYSVRENHLIVVHDGPSSKYPWETLCIEGWFPAAALGLSRKYSADNLSVAKWSEQRRIDRTLDILLIVNPTGDLAGADREGEQLQKLFQRRANIRVHPILRQAATCAAVKAAFESGRYDVLHYAGHARFDDNNPAGSGISLADGHLTGLDLASLGNLPALVFFNACESARLPTKVQVRRKDVRKRIQVNVGLAEAFLRGGVANYLGTYWPVGDDTAMTAAGSIYNAIVRGRSMGQAVAAARVALRQARSIDWADYIHYGSYDFAIKAAE
jgi:pimeloyl-ACP methyl ester carboxylesterase